MAHRVSHLFIRVEALDAVWVFGQPDKALTKLAVIVQGMALASPMPPAAYELFPDLFVEGLRAWEGLEDPDGNPLPCTKENIANIPTEEKLAVVEVYLTRRQELEAGKALPAAPPLTSTPEAESATA